MVAIHFGLSRRFSCTLPKRLLQALLDPRRFVQDDEEEEDYSDGRRVGGKRKSSRKIARQRLGNRRRR